MEIGDLVYRLNRIYKLYNRAILVSKPYRLHKIRKAYLEISDHASRAYEIIPLKSIIEYEKFLGPQPVLPELIKRKAEAIRHADYETAASLRDKEKEYIRLKIQQAGMNPHDYFYTKDGIIFFKNW